MQHLYKLETLRIETIQPQDRLERWASELLSWCPTVTTIEFILPSVTWRFLRHNFPTVIDEPDWNAWREVY